LGIVQVESGKYIGVLVYIGYFPVAKGISTRSNPAFSDMMIIVIFSRFLKALSSDESFY
jgi:GTP-dependent phosphoenolpyruvate carboxykinase